MYKIILILIFYNLLATNFSKANFDVNARTAILQDYHSGEILYEKDPNRKIFPASMTSRTVHSTIGHSASNRLIERK